MPPWFRESLSSLGDALTGMFQSPCCSRAPLLRTPQSVCPELKSCTSLGTKEALAWLWTQIDAARKEMQGHMRAEAVDLYKRRWAPTLGKDTFVAMQFNMLAEGLSASPDIKPPFQSSKPSSWGGLDSVRSREVCLSWKLRRWRLLEEILRHDPDVLSLEELDHFSDFFEPALKAAGYEGCFLGKTSSPGLEFGYYSDGVGIFWKDAAFEQENVVVEGHFEDADGSRSNQVYLLVDLRHRLSDETIRVAGTHLKAKSGEVNERLRTLHVGQLLNALCREPEPRHMVILGDFNTDPFDVSGEHMARAVPAVLDSAAPKFLSAYPLPQSSEKGDYTTWKRRGTKEDRHVIDYIFHSPSLQPRALLGMPPAEAIDTNRLPGFKYPSDHMAIAAEFEFVNSKNESSCLWPFGRPGGRCHW